MKRHVLIINSLLLLLCACSSDSDLSDDGNSNIGNSNVTLNRWVYSQMHHHYLWNEDLPDSVSLNYAQNLSEFFEQLRSPHDRFSYFKGNANYTSRVTYAPTEDYWAYPLESPMTRSINAVAEVADSLYEVDGHRIGYLLYRSFEQKEALMPSLRKFKNRQITDLVIDLRYNGGGYVETAIFLSSCLIPEAYRGTDAQYLVYNKVISNERFGSENGYDVYKYVSTDGLRNCDLQVSHVYFIVGRSTASASEATVKMVSAYCPVTLLGMPTTGKGVGMYDIKDNAYPYVLVPITFRNYNAKWETVPEDGLVPDVVMEEVYSTRLQDLGTMNDPLLSKAIQLITTKSQL